jgi:hypothetical protein
MFKASVFFQGAAADYSPDRLGRIQRSWTGSARDFIAYGNRAVERLQVLSFIFGNCNTIATFHLIISGYPAATDGVYHPLFSFAEYPLARCRDEGERTLRNLGAFAEASAAHRSLGGGRGEGR